MKEIANNNVEALQNYKKLVSLINTEISGLRSSYDFNSITATEKMSIHKILELKTKAITRETALTQRIDQQREYKLTEEQIRDAQSYSAFAAAFKPKPTVSEMFKVPSMPQPNPSSRPVSANATNSEVAVRKSLDLPRSSTQRARTSSLRSASPSKRKIRPKSVDLTVNQAAVLAWDQKTRRQSPPSRALSPPGRVHSGGKQLPTYSRKYEYIQPTINTQINLTPVARKQSHNCINVQKPRTPRTSTDQERLTFRKSYDIDRSTTRESLDQERPVLANSNSNITKEPSPAGHKKYTDPRIQEMMDNLQGVDRQACEQILDEIIVTDEKLTWDDLAGLKQAKKSLKETVVYPFLRPDLFKGLREPISGMLLFGPPGTGKTMIAKTVANESHSTFFSISASSLLSKYLGESEKLIRALFYIAKKLSPSIIFFDEIDSLLTTRGDGENESSRRVKTEFLIQWSSLTSATSHQETDTPRVLVLAATNLPWAIDDAARRRLTRRLYIPLPESETRLAQLRNLFKRSHHSLSDRDFILIANMTEGYSNSDLTALAKEAAMEPIRDLGENLMNIGDQEIRGVNIADFERAMRTIKKSVGKETLQRFQDWASRYGSTGA